MPCHVGSYLSIILTQKPCGLIQMSDRGKGLNNLLGGERLFSNLGNFTPEPITISFFKIF